jgi:hypothetical protein
VGACMRTLPVFLPPRWRESAFSFKVMNSVIEIARTVLAGREHAREQQHVACVAKSAYTSYY